MNFADRGRILRGQTNFEWPQLLSWVVALAMHLARNCCSLPRGRLSGKLETFCNSCNLWSGFGARSISLPVHNWRAHSLQIFHHVFCKVNKLSRALNAIRQPIPQLNKQDSQNVNSINYCRSIPTFWAKFGSRTKIASCQLRISTNFVSKKLLSCSWEWKDSWKFAVKSYPHVRKLSEKQTVYWDLLYTFVNQGHLFQLSASCRK